MTSYIMLTTCSVCAKQKEGTFSHICNHLNSLLEAQKSYDAIELKFSCQQ